MIILAAKARTRIRRTVPRLTKTPSACGHACTHRTPSGGRDRQMQGVSQFVTPWRSECHSRERADGYFLKHYRGAHLFFHSTLGA